MVNSRKGHGRQENMADARTLHAGRLRLQAQTQHAKLTASLQQKWLREHASKLRLTIGTLPVMFIGEQTEAEETAEHRELSTVNTTNVKETKNVKLPAYQNSITDCKSAARI